MDREPGRHGPSGLAADRHVVARRDRRLRDRRVLGGNRRRSVACPVSHLDREVERSDERRHGDARLSPDRHRAGDLRRQSDSGLLEGNRRGALGGGHEWRDQVERPDEPRHGPARLRPCRCFTRLWKRVRVLGRHVREAVAGQLGQHELERGEPERSDLDRLRADGLRTDRRRGRARRVRRVLDRDRLEPMGGPLGGPDMDERAEPWPSRPPAAHRDGAGHDDDPAATGTRTADPRRDPDAVEMARRPHPSAQAPLARQLPGPRHCPGHLPGAPLPANAWKGRPPPPAKAEQIARGSRVQRRAAADDHAQRARWIPERARGRDSRRRAAAGEAASVAPPRPGAAGATRRAAARGRRAGP